MESNSNFDPVRSATGSESAPPEQKINSTTTLGKSEAETLFAPDTRNPEAPLPERDLGATLHLLAERAQYLTGSSSATIALGEGRDLVCKASSGQSALPPGAQIQIDSALSSELMAECVSTRQPAKCDNTENDPRVDAETCRMQSVGSVLVAPLIRGQEVVGVFELLAERRAAFEEKDIAAVQRLAGLVLTALEQAEPIAGNAADGSLPTPRVDRALPLALQNGLIPLPRQASLDPNPPQLEGAARLSRGQDLGTCRRCGFPVSPGRAICLDCEAAEIAEGRSSALDSPGLFPHLAAANQKESWWHANFYTIGIILVTVLTAIVLTLWAR